jgi:NADPH:quinone reductase-like Zn-dependent oxidoreductase
MKAIRLHEPVGVEGLVYEEAPDPVPGVGDVLVEVRACGFTASELYWPIWTDRNGHQRSSVIPGQEVSGVVVGLGYGTAGVAVGDEVYGLTDAYRDGAAAGLMAVEARDVAPKPTSIDHVQAASLPQAGLTSWQALFTHGGLTAGQTVVVHGAAGAVGSIAVQLARTVDANVVATGRAAHRDLALDHGADEFVALDEGWEEAIGPRADLVFDAVGGDVLERSPAAVRPGGALITVVGQPPDTRTDIRTLSFVREPDRAQLVEIARLVDAGAIRPQVGAVYPLAQGREAFAAKSTPGIPGRVILQP